MKIEHNINDINPTKNLTIINGEKSHNAILCKKLSDAGD